MHAAEVHQKGDCEAIRQRAARALVQGGREEAHQAPPRNDASNSDRASTPPEPRRERSIEASGRHFSTWHRAPCAVSRSFIHTKRCEGRSAAKARYLGRVGNSGGLALLPEECAWGTRHLPRRPYILLPSGRVHATDQRAIYMSQLYG